MRFVRIRPGVPAALALLALLPIAPTPVRAWDTKSCGSKASFLPDLDCKNERCCQCNYQWDLELCGQDEYCKKGALSTLEACQRRALAATKAAGLHILDQAGGETWQIVFHAAKAGPATLWILNGNGNAPGDPFAVDSAEVHLNGDPVIDRSRLHGAVGELRLPVDLQAGPNQIAVAAEGRAGSTLTVLVY